MYTFQHHQELCLSIEQCWEFFSNPANLKVLTPPSLRMDIEEKDNSPKIYPGMILSHTIRPFLNIPLQWISEITHILPFQYFIDEQLYGPYKFWHHEHRFRPSTKGVEVSDTIHYMMPYGYLGQAAHRLGIKQKIEEAFVFRKNTLEELFGSST